MKILVISHMFPNPANSTNGIFVYHRVKELLKSGIELKVVNPQPKCFPFLKNISRYKKYCSISKKYEFDNIEVLSPKYTYLPVKYFRNRIGFLMSKAVSKYMDSLRTENFSLIHAHGAVDGGLVAMDLSKKLGIPYIVTAHGSDINYSIGDKIKEKYLFHVLSNAKKVIFVSGALKERARELTKYEEESAVVIPNGVDTNIFKLMDKSVLREKLNIPPHSKVISFVGNLLPVKGAHLLPAIFKGVKEKIPYALLYIVGDGPLENKIKEEFLGFNISKDVVFVGRVPQTEVAKYMNLSDALILPSLNEGQGAVINESLACGTPVVGSNVGGIPEALGGQQYGKIFPKGNIDKAIEAVLEVLSQEWDRKKLNEKASKFSWRNTVIQEIKVYKEVINNV